MTLDEYVNKATVLLERIEAAHQSTGRRIARLHKLLADGVAEHGAALGVSGDVVAFSIAPKDPNPED